MLEGGGGARVTTLSSRDRPRGTPPRDKEEKEEPLAGRGWGRGLKVHGASSCGAQQAGVCMCVEEEEEGGGGIGVFFWVRKSVHNKRVCACGCCCCCCYCYVVFVRIPIVGFPECSHCLIDGQKGAWLTRSSRSSFTSTSRCLAFSSRSAC